MQLREDNYLFEPLFTSNKTMDIMKTDGNRWILVDREGRKHAVHVCTIKQQLSTKYRDLERVSSFDAHVGLCRGTELQCVHVACV